MLGAMRLAALLLVTVCGAAAAQPDTAAFLGEMTDLERLTRLPQPHYINRQFSSWDRNSRVDGGRKIAWFANRDAGQYLREERRGDTLERVMMDAEGPGVITRIWSANPDNTQIRIYLDGATEPILAEDFLALTTAKVPGFPAPFSHRLSGGANLYFPIPYAKHCKVTHTGGGIYYQINYRTYPKSTRIRSFSPSDLEKLKAQIQSVGETLTDPDRLNRKPNRRERFRLAAGESVVALRESGPAAIRYLSFTLGEGDALRALRNTLIQITFDEARQPQVECPLGDLFGTGPGANPYVSLPATVTKEGEMRLRFVMPFERSAVVRLRNLGQAPMSGTLQAAVEPYRWRDDSLHFHAKWRADHDIPTRPFRDMRFINVTGAGRYVGTHLSLTNPWKMWWGEGDEKIWVDGEAFPSHFGTGTEDYFGYAWGDPHLYTHAYHAQPRCDGPGTFGYNSEVRWHVMDDIPFREQFQFDMELWHWGVGVMPTYGRLAYYYARPGSWDDHPAAGAVALELVPPPAKPLDDAPAK